MEKLSHGARTILGMIGTRIYDGGHSFDGALKAPQNWSYLKKDSSVPFTHTIQVNLIINSLIRIIPRLKMNDLKRYLYPAELVRRFLKVLVLQGFQ